MEDDDTKDDDMEDELPFVNMYGEYPCDKCREYFTPTTTYDYRALQTVCLDCRDDAFEGALARYVDLIVERKMREADVSDGSRVPHGSTKHIKDLEKRIAELESWRGKQKRGSENRANYSRLISRLKGELASARRAFSKKKGGR
jgi:hypothetical protein